METWLLARGSLKLTVSNNRYSSTSTMMAPFFLASVLSGGNQSPCLDACSMFPAFEVGRRVLISAHREVLINLRMEMY
jgi:hypothetical protein